MAKSLIVHKDKILALYEGRQGLRILRSLHLTFHERRPLEISSRREPTTIPGAAGFAATASPQAPPSPAHGLSPRADAEAADLLSWSRGATAHSAGDYDCKVVNPPSCYAALF